jgi:hypothetical protein
MPVEGVLVHALLEQCMNTKSQPIAIAKDLAGASLAREQFAQLVAACRYDPHFPLTYEAWIALVELGNQAAIASGHAVPEVCADVEAFIAWCGYVQVQPGIDALRAYLTLLRRNRPGAAT